MKAMCLPSGAHTGLEGCLMSISCSIVRGDFAAAVCAKAAVANVSVRLTKSAIDFQAIRMAPPGQIEQRIQRRISGRARLPRPSPKEPLPETERTHQNVTRSPNRVAYGLMVA